MAVAALSSPVAPSTTSHRLQEIPCPSCRNPFRLCSAETLPIDFTKNALSEALAQGEKMEGRGRKKKSQPETSTVARVIELETVVNSQQTHHSRQFPQQQPQEHQRQYPHRQPHHYRCEQQHQQPHKQEEFDYSYGVAVDNFSAAPTPSQSYPDEVAHLFANITNI
jgi:hypothetical protein